MILFDWLSNYLIHSSVLLALAWGTRAIPTLRDATWQDAIWKTALLAGVITASAQTLTPLGSTLQIGHGTPAADQTHVITGAPSEPTPAAQATSKPRQVSAPPPARIIVEPAISTVSPAAEQRDLRGAALIAWLATATWLLIGLARRVRAERRLLADRDPISGAKRTEACAGHPLPRSIRLSTSDAITAPLATRGGEIVVPMNFTSLAPEHRAAALAHEQAHIERRDPHWRLATMLLAQLFFIQPLNRLGLREISRNAEALSDRNAVASTGGSRQSLAECLAHFAGVPTARTPATLCAMSAGRLPERIEALLASGDLGRARGRAALPMLLVVTLTGALGLPGISAGLGERTLEVDSGWKGTSTNVHDDDGRVEMSISHRDEERRLRVKAEGRIRFNESFTDIVAIDDGFFRLRVDEGGERREVDLRGRRGELTREYEIDGRDAPWDSEAQAWFAQALTHVFRVSGIQGDDHVAALLEGGGVDAVLSEIDAIESDLVGRLYVSALAKAATLDDRQLDGVLAYVDEAIESDLETRLALATIIDHQDLNTDAWGRVLDATAIVRSDLEQRLLLSVAADRMPQNLDLLERFLSATESINSDLERRLALSSLGGRLADADEQLMIRVIEAADEIRSDLERRLALGAVVEYIESDRTARAYIDTAGTIRSDLEARLALNKLLTDVRLDEATAAHLVDVAAEAIRSDLELRLLLGRVVDGYGDSPVVRDALIRALDKIGSDFERNQIARRLAV